MSIKRNEKKALLKKKKILKMKDKFSSIKEKLFLKMRGIK